MHFQSQADVAIVSYISLKTDQLGIPSISYSQVLQNKSGVAVCGLCFRHGGFNTCSRAARHLYESKDFARDTFPWPKSIKLIKNNHQLEHDTNDKTACKSS
jgi:hypothetical protein